LHVIDVRSCHPVLRLCKKLPAAAEELKTSDAAFRVLNDSSDPKLVKVWTAQDAAAQADRNNNEAAMDIFDIKVDKGEFPEC